jgi:hypothetical protein
MLGLVYRLFFRRGQASPLWWAWVPFVLFGALSAEQHLGETLNSVSKAFVVMWAVTRFVPGWRTLPRRVRARRPGPALASPLAVGGPLEGAR